MDEVAVTATLTSAFVVLTAFGLPKISDRRILDYNLLHIVKFTVQRPKAALSLLFSCELDIDVTHHMLSYIIGHHQIQNFPMLAELSKDLLVELFKVRGCFQ